MSFSTSTQTVFAAQALLPSGWQSNVRLSHADGRFCGIEIGAQAQAGDHHADIVLPPMPNLHSHAFQRAFAGLAEMRRNPADSFWTWREQMYALAHRITPDDMRPIAAQLYMEMLKAGFTQVAEFHYLHRTEDGTPYSAPGEMALSVIAGAIAAGMGITMLPTLYRHAGFGVTLKPEQRRFESSPDFIAGILSEIEAAYSGNLLVKAGVGLHSLRAVDRGDILEMLSLVPASMPVHIHIAEQKKEVSDCVAALGKRPVAWLLDKIPVDPRWCLVHATHMEPEETRCMALSGAVAGLCPITEANLGDGLFPVDGFMDAGGSWGIGTDSNILPSVNEELRLLEYGQRLFEQKRCRVLPGGAVGSVGRYLYEAAVQGGAQACQHDGGALAVGKRADLCGVRQDALSLPDLHGDHVLDSLIFARSNFPAADILCAGKWVVQNGRHYQEEKITTEFRSAIRKLRA